jgi:hypothetical protein
LAQLDEDVIDQEPSSDFVSPNELPASIINQTQLVDGENSEKSEIWRKCSAIE